MSDEQRRRAELWLSWWTCAGLALAAGLMLHLWR